MKKLRYFCTLLLMAVVSVAWAQTQETHTIGWGTASGDAGTFTNFTDTSGEVAGVLSFTSDKNSSSTVPAYNANNSDLRLYYNSSGDGGSITITPKEGITITGAVITTSTLPAVAYYVDGGSATSVSGSSNTYTISNISASSSLKIQNVNTSNTQLRIKTIAITYTSGGSSSVATTTTIDASGITNTDVYTSTAAGTLTATVTETESGNAVSGATVTWTSSKENVATIDENGVVTLVAAGTTTITANYAGVSGEFGSSAATYELTVTSSAPYVQPTTIEITPNYDFWGQTAQFSGSTYSELSGEKDNVTLEWTRGSGSTYANQNAMRFYKDNTLNFTAPDGYEIKSIEFAYSTSQSDLEFSPEGYNSESNIWTGSSATVTMTRPSDASSYAQITKITITLGSPSTDPTITADNVNIAYDATGGEIAYTVNNPVDGASVNATTDADWISFGTNFNSPIAFSCSANDGAERTATVTLTYSYGDNETVTKNVTVTQAAGPNAPGTANNPYSVAEARAAIDANTGITGVYAMGIVSEIVTPLNAQYGNITYNISADGTTTADQLQAYRGKSYNGDNFTSEDDIKVGDEVVVFGNLVKYNNTYEFAADNQLVSLNRPVVTNPTVTVSPASVNVDAAEHDGTITVTLENMGTNLDFGVLFYDATGAPADFDWIAAVIDNDNNVYYTIAANTSEEARTAYLKVMVADQDAKEVYWSDVITFTQAGYVAPYATLPFEYNDGRDGIENTSGLSHVGLGTDYNANTNPTTLLKFDTTGDYLLLQFNEEPGKLSFDIKGNSFSGGTFTVQVSEDGQNFTELASYTELGNTETKEFVNLGANVRYIKWVYTEKVNGNVGLGNIKLEKPATTVTITIKKGFTATTFSCDKALDFSNQNIIAYIITDENGTTAQVTKVPANTGIYVEGAAGDYEVPVAVAESNFDDTSGNILFGVLNAQSFASTADVTYYAFGKQNGKEAFYKVPTTGYTLQEGNKALLKVNTPAAGAKDVIFVNGGVVTGIGSIDNGQTNSRYYTVDGKLVKGQPAQKGVYIANGRKIVIK